MAGTTTGRNRRRDIAALLHGASTSWTRAPAAASQEHETGPASWWVEIKKGFALVEELFVDLAVPEGVLHVGPSGTGHFVKNIHNMIEFGMVQAIGEGVELLKLSEWDIDLADLFHNWNHGSVIRSWLVELMERALRSKHHMKDLEPYIEDTGEQRWGVEFALAEELPIPLLAQAVWGF